MGSIEAVEPALTEPEAERRHERRMAVTENWWGFLRLLVIVGGVVACVALVLPAAHVFAGLTTIVNVTVDVALTFAVTATLSAAVTGVGWAITSRGQRAARRETQRLRRENRELKAHIEALKSPQPMLETEPPEEGRR